MNGLKTARFVAVISVCISFTLCALQIQDHALNNRHPKSRRLTIRILCMVPIYATESFIGLLSPNLSIYCDTFRDFYEALVIYSFFQLLTICLLDGERQIVEVLRECDRTSHIPPFCCLANWEPGAEMYVKTKVGILQYVPIKLITAFLTFMLWGLNAYDNGSFALNNGYMYIAVITNISQTWAIYCLVIFYLGCKSRLKAFNPIPKFLCIKLVVFATFWQSCLIALFVKLNVIRDTKTWTSDNIATGIQDFLICLEMIVASIGHWYAFRPSDFRRLVDGSDQYYETLLRSRTLWTTANAADFSDVVSDVQREIVDTTILNIATKTPFRYIPQIRRRYENPRIEESRHNQELSVLLDNRKALSAPLTGRKHYEPLSPPELASPFNPPNELPILEDDNEGRQSSSQPIEKSKVLQEKLLNLDKEDSKEYNETSSPVEHNNGKK